jgi:hypothetical protein
MRYPGGLPWLRTCTLLVLSLFITSRSFSIGSISCRVQNTLTKMASAMESRRAPPGEENTAASSVIHDDELLDKVLKVAMAASKRAGDIILGNAGGAAVTERKANSRDLLTLIDPLCEKVSVDFAHFQKQKVCVHPPLFFSTLTDASVAAIDNTRNNCSIVSRSQLPWRRRRCAWKGGKFGCTRFQTGRC